jgi:hypothetical protein
VPLGEPVDHLVVEADEDRVQLGDDAVLVVPRIADERASGRVARMVARFGVRCAAERRPAQKVHAVRLVELR